MRSFPISMPNVRWWFHSRPTGKLNGFSYWLLALIPAALIYLILTFVLPPTAINFGHLRTDSDYSNWISSRLPPALAASNASGDSTFVEALTKLVANVRYGSQPSRAPLYLADRIGDEGKPCTNGPRDAWSMFGEGEIHVYPSCVTFTTDSSRKLSKGEEVVFKNFAAYITNLFATTPTSGETGYTERVLARSMGLSEATDPPFDVPWIYIASYPSGAIAVFPGTTVIKGSTWETKSRPWYQAAFSGESQLASKGLRDGDSLTVTYLDVLAKKPILVRTYLYKFDVGQPDAGQFVLGIDLHRRDGATRRATLWGVDLALLPSTVKLVVSAVVSIILFLMFRWMSSNYVRMFVFERLPESKYGVIGLKRTTQVRGHRQSSTESKIELMATQYGVSAGTTTKTEKSDGVDVDTTVEEALGLSRGVEWWRVYRDRRTSWRLLWLRFENVRRVNIGQIQIVYSKAILPHADWMYGSFNAQAFSDPDANRYRERLPAILKQNADSWDGGYFEISDIDGRVPSSPYVDRIPEWVRSVVRAEEVFAVRQGRAYLTLSSTRLDEMYSKADVKAVVLSTYFERLLRHGQTDFLLRGRTIHRLVSFPDEDAELDLAGSGQSSYNALLNSYSPIRSRTLARVNGPIDVEGSAPQPVYDFAILDDQMLVVTHTVMEAALIDVASGREEKPTYRVEGYISWRRSDLEFYKEMFGELSKRSTPFATQQSTGTSAKASM